MRAVKVCAAGVLIEGAREYRASEYGRQAGAAAGFRNPATSPRI